MALGSGLDEGMLRVTNYQNHPTNNAYKVFFFYNKEQANYFVSLLKEKNIWFEQDEDVKANAPIYLFGIKKKDLEKVHVINNITIGKFREKLIPSKAGRIVVIVIGLSIIIFSILGYFMSK